MLMSGAVPVYWGDRLDYQIFNRERILGARDVNESCIIHD